MGTGAVGGMLYRGSHSTPSAISEANCESKTFSFVRRVYRPHMRAILLGQTASRTDGCGGDDCNEAKLVTFLPALSSESGQWHRLSKLTYPLGSSIAKDDGYITTAWSDDRPGVSCLLCRATRLQPWPTHKPRGGQRRRGVLYVSGQLLLIAGASRLCCSGAAID
jgi:hypothetical protein